MNLVCAEKVEYFKGTGLFKEEHAHRSISVYWYTNQSYPKPVATLADTVMGFLVDDSNGDMILQKRERNDEPGWPTPNLLHNARSTLAMSIAP